MLKSIAIPVQNLFFLAFKKKNANYTSMNKFVIINRETHRHHFHAGCKLAIKLFINLILSTYSIKQ